MACDGRGVGPRRLVPPAALAAALLVVRTAALSVLAPAPDGGAELGERPREASLVTDHEGDHFDTVLRRHADSARSRSLEHADGNEGPGSTGLAMDVHLLVSLYLPEKNASQEVHAHVKEMLAAFSVNLQNPVFSTLHVLLEAPGRKCSALPVALARSVDRTVYEAELDRVFCVAVPQQPTYEDFFTYANNSVSRSGVVVLANADIVFDGTLRHIEQLRPGREGHLISVRAPHYAGEFRSIFHRPCDAVLDKCTRHTKSWDAYVFSLPLPARLAEFDLQFTMNVLTADHRAAYALNQSGMTLTNPCMHINAFHWHCFSPKMHADFRDEDNNGSRLSGIFLKSHPCQDFPHDRCAKEVS